MIYQKLTTGMGQCLLLIRKHADRDGFESVSYTHLTLPTN